MSVDPHEAAARLASGRSIVIEVTTDSMRPTLEPGMRAVVHPGSPKVGDVILIRGRSHLLIHRLVAVIHLPGYLRYVEAGDAGSTPALILPSTVLGVTDLPRRAPGLVKQALMIARALYHAGKRRWQERTKG